MSRASHPGAICTRCGCKAALNRRLAWLRRTALPTVRPAATAKRVCEEPSFFCTTNTTSGWAYDLPSRRTRWKSVELDRRNLCCTLYGSLPGRLRVPVDFFDVVIFSNGQSIAAFGAAAFQDIAAIGSRHAGAEAVHTHTTADLWLVSTLGHSALFLF